MPGAILQFCAVIVAAIATIYVTGQGDIVTRKCLELIHGKVGCVPVPELENITLHYFAVRGRAESIRLILEDTEITYIQNLFTKESWPAAKTSGIENGYYPFGQVPVMVTDNGFSLAQSHAIVHYLGRTKGLDCECVDIQQCEVLVAGADDFGSKLSKVVWDPEFSADMWDDYLKNVAPMWLTHFEKLAPQIRNKETSFFSGGRITWVDYILFDMLDLQMEFGKVDVGLSPVDVLKPYPKLSSFYNRFRTREKIASYLNSERRLPYNGPKVTTPKKEETKEQKKQ